MKKLLCIFIIAQCSTFAYSGKDSVYVQIINDTVKVWNVGVEENCCIRVVTTTNISNDSIIVLEHDTSNALCNCMCTFDFSVSLTGLQPGTYHVLVYRQHTIFTPESLYFVGTVSFTYSGGITGAIKSTAYQSTCYHPPIVAVEEPKRLPVYTTLSQNYPNPFNPSTTIHFELPKESHVTLKVYNMLGQEVLTVLDEDKVAGRYDLKIDGTSLASGVYFYRLIVGNFVEVKKMVLLK